MKIFKLRYYYLATGMEGVADEYPEQTITAESYEKAVFEYFYSNGVFFGSFEEYMELEPHVRTWGIISEEIKK